MDAFLSQTRDLSKVHKKKKSVDFSLYKLRHIALKMSYLGWNYNGLALQGDTPQTVMEQLLEGLLKTQIIENRESTSLTCCGRTDKGVSGLSQVISLKVRSLLSGSEGIGFVEESGPQISLRKNVPVEEMDYVFLLNRVMPRDVRVTAWAPVSADFSARFNCKSRVYKYLFPRGEFDLKIMEEASQLLVGEHDFRNFCKMDVNVVNYVRRIHSISIKMFKPHETNQRLDMYVITIRGTAFLYHMIRCIMNVLFLIARGREQPQVISELLDTKSSNGKPQYQLAAELPLVFYNAEFEDLQWCISDAARQDLQHCVENLWISHSIQSSIIEMMRSQISENNSMKESDSSGLEKFLTVDFKSKNHKPLLKRMREDSFEVKQQKAEEKRQRKLKAASYQDVDSSG